MRRLFLELFFSQTFPSTPITSFSPFLSYIVVTPLMLGFEKTFHVIPIQVRFGSLRCFLFLPHLFLEMRKKMVHLNCIIQVLIACQKSYFYNWQVTGLFKQVVFSVVFPCYNFRTNSVDPEWIGQTFRQGAWSRLFCVVFILVRLLESHPAVVGTARKIQPLHLLHCPQPFLVPLLKQNGFMFFHRLVIPFRSYLFLQFRSRLVHKI
uniref:Cytochrome c biogenesis protein n=1 Tax=Helianthus annuus TaxID=4232 RepID=Q05H68_HELAN|nr:cytochrome c biogenesis protein [Helianthus annuus]